MNRLINPGSGSEPRQNNPGLTKPDFPGRIWPTFHFAIWLGRWPTRMLERTPTVNGPAITTVAVVDKGLGAYVEPKPTKEYAFYRVIYP